MKNKNGIGLHILLDLHDCNFNEMPIDEEGLRKFVSHLEKNIREMGLTILDTVLHFFEPRAFSILFGLSESHISIHTWPELNFVSADVFVCNHSKDNTEIAKNVSRHLQDIFKSGDSKVQEVQRANS